MNKEHMQKRLAELDEQIDSATGWGAWLGAVVEERDEIARFLGLPVRRLVGGIPMAD